MSQNSYLYNPWIWGLSAALLMGAAYAPYALQWHTHNTTAQKSSYKIVQSPVLPSNNAVRFSETTTAADAFQNSAPSQPNQTIEIPNLSLTPKSPAGKNAETLDVSQKNKTQIDNSKAAFLKISDDEAQMMHNSSKVPTQPAIQPPIQKSFAMIQPSAQRAEQNVPTENTAESEKTSTNTMPTLGELLQGLVIIEYENELVVEFNQAKFPRLLMQNLLARVMLTPNPIDPFSLLEQAVTRKGFATQLQPHFYQRIYNRAQQPIRYPAQAYAYAEDLLMQKARTIADENQVFVQVPIELKDLQDWRANYVVKPRKQMLPAGQNLPYESLVNKFSRKFSVKKELIYAIMQVESAFNPKAVSQSNALGLMQIKPEAAGKDVYNYVDSKAGQPDRQTLFNPEENIRIGTAYLDLLANKYFEKIENPQTREMLVISAYNGGLNTVFKVFGRTQEAAIERINQMLPSQVFQKLRSQHPSEETRQYLQKVVQAQKQYESNAIRG